MSLNATVEAKKAQKYDVALEQKVRSWIADLLPEHKASCLDSSIKLDSLLKDGVILLSLLDVIAPGKAPKPSKMKIAFKQMENIQNYLKTCVSAVGLQQTELFETLDLYEARDLTVVLAHLAVLKFTYEKYLSSKSSSDSATPTGSTTNSSSPKAVPKILAGPTIEKKPTQSSPIAIVSADLHTKRREISGSPLSGSPNAKGPKSSADVTSLADDVAAKEEFKFDSEVASAVKKWLESSLNITIGELISSIKSGVILCKLLNKIKPNLVSKIYEGNVAYLQMENVSRYIKGCLELGVSPTEMFETNDLVNEKNLSMVLSHLYALALFVQRKPELKWNGPSIDAVTSRSLFAATLVGGDLQELQVDNTPLSPEQQDLLAWANFKIMKSGRADMTLSNMSSDARTSVKLICLVEQLTASPSGLPYNRHPTQMWHVLQNASLLLRYISSQTFEKVEGVRAADIVLGNSAAVSRLLTYLRGKFDLDFMFKELLGPDIDTAGLASDDEEEFEVELEEGMAVPEFLRSHIAADDLARFDEAYRRAQEDDDAFSDTSDTSSSSSSSFNYDHVITHVESPPTPEPAPVQQPQPQPEAAKKSPFTERKTTPATAPAVQPAKTFAVEKDPIVTASEPSVPVNLPPEPKPKPEEVQPTPKPAGKEPQKPTVEPNKQAPVVKPAPKPEVKPEIVPASTGPAPKPEPKPLVVPTAFSKPDSPSETKPIKPVAKPMSDSKPGTPTTPKPTVTIPESKPVVPETASPKPEPSPTTVEVKILPEETSKSPRTATEVAPKNEPATQEPAQLSKPKDVSHVQIPAETSAQDMSQVDPVKPPSEPAPVPPQLERPPSDPAPKPPTVEKHPTDAPPTTHTTEKKKSSTKINISAAQRPRSTRQPLPDMVGSPRGEKRKVKVYKNQLPNESQPATRDRSGSVSLSAEQQKRIADAQAVVRMRVAQELLSTERSYVNSLRVLLSGFIDRARRESILSAAEIKHAFSNIEDICAVNGRFEAELSQIIEIKKETAGLPALFKSYTADMNQAYAPFISNYNNCMVALQILRLQNPKLVSLQTAFEEELMKTTMYNVESFVIMPVQRIPRYLLLLKDILKYTPKDSPEHPALSDAIDSIDIMLKELNSKIDRDQVEHLRRQLMIAQSIEQSIDIFSTQRKYVGEAALVVKRFKILDSKKADDNRKRKSAMKKVDYIFFLSDIALFCTNLNAKSEDQKQFSHVETLQTSTLAIASTEASLASAGLSAKTVFKGEKKHKDCQFALIHLIDGAPIEWWLIEARSPLEKESLILILKGTISVGTN